MKQKLVALQGKTGKSEIDNAGFSSMRGEKLIYSTVWMDLKGITLSGIKKKKTPNRKE